MPVIVYVPWSARAMGTTPAAYYLDCATRHHATAVDPVTPEAERGEWRAEAAYCRTEAWRYGGPKPARVRRRATPPAP